MEITLKSIEDVERQLKREISSLIISSESNQRHYLMEYLDVINNAKFLYQRVILEKKPLSFRELIKWTIKITRDQKRVISHYPYLTEKYDSLFLFASSCHVMMISCL